jgi:hypothetical protein
MSLCLIYSLFSPLGANLDAISLLESLTPMDGSSPNDPCPVRQSVVSQQDQQGEAVFDFLIMFWTASGQVL